MLLDTGFNTVIAHEVFKPGQLSHITESRFVAEPETDEYSRSITGTVTFSRSRGTRLWSDYQFLDTLADYLIDFYSYDEDRFDVHDESNYPVLTLRIQDVVAIIELINIDERNAMFSIKVPLDTSVDTDQAFLAVKDTLRLWSEVHDFISYQSKGKHQKANERHTEIAIERYEQTESAMRAWQALLAYEGWRERMDSPTLPKIKHDEIDVERLGELLDLQPDDFDFVKAIQRTASQVRKSGGSDLTQTEFETILQHA